MVQMFGRFPFLSEEWCLSKQWQWWKTFVNNFFLSGGDDDYQDNEDKICEDFLPIRRDEWGWGSWQTAWAPDRGPSFDQDNDDDFEGVDDIETLCLSISIIWWTSSLTQL